MNEDSLKLLIKLKDKWAKVENILRIMKMESKNKNELRNTGGGKREIIFEKMDDFENEQAKAEWNPYPPDMSLSTLMEWIAEVKLLREENYEMEKTIAKMDNKNGKN